MVIVIPKMKKGLKAIEEGMLGLSVEEYLAELSDFKKELSKCILNITLPKFEFESDLDLMKPLKQLGIHDAFNIEEADFSGVSNDPFGLYISSVIQKAMIRVDEEGTTAAAVTMKMASGCGARKKPPKVINVVADHPFYFQVIEQNMKVVLFSGVVTDPRKSE